MLKNHNVTVYNKNTQNIAHTKNGKKSTLQTRINTAIFPFKRLRKEKGNNYRVKHKTPKKGL